MSSLEIWRADVTSAKADVTSAKTRCERRPRHGRAAPDELDRYLRREEARWRKVIQDGGIKVE